MDLLKPQLQKNGSNYDYNSFGRFKHTRVNDVAYTHHR